MLKIGQLGDASRGAICHNGSGENIVDFLYCNSLNVSDPWMGGYQIQVENYKLITEVNAELLDEYQFTKGELPVKLELAQSYINKSHEREELGDHTQSHEVLSSANMIIGEAGAAIKLVRSQVISSNDGYNWIKDSQTML